MHIGALSIALPDQLPQVCDTVPLQYYSEAKHALFTLKTIRSWNLWRQLFEMICDELKGRAYNIFL